MKRKVALKSMLKTLPVLASLAVGVGATIAIINKDKLEDKVADKLIARQITKEHIPLQ
jgi:hypothetical protein